MTVGSRIVFMRFVTVRSPKLQLWIDHFDGVVGHDAERLSPPTAKADESAFVWHLISANNRMLARGSRIHFALEDAMSDNSRVQSEARWMHFTLVVDRFRGRYGWYASVAGNVMLTCARWYVTERDSRSSINLARSSLAVAVSRPGARLVQTEVAKSL